MNLRFVEAFHWAVALKSVTRAAEKLHLTQSALSSRIAALERELGVLLLDRRDKQFRLTVAGQRFHAFAQRLLEMQMHIKAEMGSGVARETVLRVGAIESVVHSWLTGWLKHMQATYPDFELELTVETTPVLVDQLRAASRTSSSPPCQLRATACAPAPCRRCRCASSETASCIAAAATRCPTCWRWTC
ncbi:hypothetical protein GCM10023165_19670 [Variovorax defluvii]|uniref:HTH lysR-type domain-containing protein n=1 Tax=Variovorax defluvii TaxID=913761 RepID=A0ABP8HIV2_9BURK